MHFFIATSDCQDCLGNLDNLGSDMKNQPDGIISVMTGHPMSKANVGQIFKKIFVQTFMQNCYQRQPTQGEIQHPHIHRKWTAMLAKLASQNQVSCAF